MSDETRTIYIAGINSMRDELPVLEYEAVMVRGRWRPTNDRGNFGAMSGFARTLPRDLSEPVRVDTQIKPERYACFDREKVINAAIGAAHAYAVKLRGEAGDIDATLVKFIGDSVLDGGPRFTWPKTQWS